MGNVGRLCRCQKPLTPMKLLFPIKKKDYTTDVAISKSWDDSRTLYKPQYSFVNLGKSRSVEKYKTTKRLLFNGFKISFYALSLIGLERTLLLPSYR